MSHSTSRNSRPRYRSRRVLIGVTLCAVLGAGLTPGGSATGAGGGDQASASAGKGPKAVAARRCTKIKKGKRKGKRRCKPVARFAVTWDDDADIDLFVFDRNLRRSSPFRRRAIPGTVHSPNSKPEAFIDFNRPSRRRFAIAICLAREPFADPTNYTLFIQFANGRKTVVEDQLFDAEQVHVYRLDNPTDPDPGLRGNYCHARG